MKYLAAEIEIMLVFKNTKQGVVNYLILTQGNIKRVLNELTPAVTEGGGEIRPKARNKVSERVFCLRDAWWQEKYMLWV